MSRLSKTDVQCPKCGHNQTATTWLSLNADVDPTLKEDLLGGRINVFQCEKCDYHAPLGVSLLYHDMVRRFMVKYHPFKSLEEPEFFREYDANGDSVASVIVSQKAPKLYQDYMARVHVVFQMSEMIRYIKFREQLHAHHQGGGGNAEPLS